MVTKNIGPLDTVCQFLKTAQEDKPPLDEISPNLVTLLAKQLHQ
jgi:hypothetical protein